MNQEPNKLDKLALALVKHELDLKAAKKELLNENLTEGQTRSVYVEIAQLEFCIKTLNFINNE